jgi:DNA mismatch endonuclease, patch repair protein
MDIGFTRARVAVFVDGCFWHGCPLHATWPTANADWWAAKINKNRERDGLTTAHLLGLGWAVVRVWEHEAPGEAADRVQEIVLGRRARQHSVSGRP